MTDNINELDLRSPIRVGVLLSADIDKASVPALKYLILHLNCLQSSFEYEFLPVPTDDPLLSYIADRTILPRKRRIAEKLRFRRKAVELDLKDWPAVKRDIPEFLNRYYDYLDELRRYYELAEHLPQHYALISLAQFSSSFYLLREKEFGVIALGNWERVMAPPSLLEFIVTLLLAQSVDLLGTPVDNISHLGTKGCLFDFTAHLRDARFKILQGFICNHCRQTLYEAGYPKLADELVAILKKDWLGQPTNPSSPAGIISKLGYNLFLVKELQPTHKEKILATLQKEGVEEALKIISAIILALIIFYLGVKSG